jgi:hypothetical protein
MKAVSPLFVYSFLFSSFLRITSTTPDTITPSHPIRDDHGETLVSAGGTFKLGFFSPGSSKNRYVGIWYVISNQTVVWVANRETPLENHSGVLKVTVNGSLVLLDTTNNTIIWSSSNTSRTAGNNPTAQLFDSGNIVVKDRNIDNILWQSFDHPCDTFLPDMKVGWDSATGLDSYLTSWKSTEDPAHGEFLGKLDRRGLPQLVVLKGSKIKSRPGSWNGLYFTGSPWLKPNPLFKYEFVWNEKEVSYEYKLLNKSIFSRYEFVLNEKQFNIIRCNCG